MNASKSRHKKENKLSNRKNASVRILSKCIIIFINTSVGYILFSMIISEASGQAPYINSKTSQVTMRENATASVFCNDGDGMISGGYSIDSATRQSVFDTMLFSNHPTQKINQSGYFEGWEAGLVNKGNATAKITATVLCLNLTLTP